MKINTVGVMLSSDPPTHTHTPHTHISTLDQNQRIDRKSLTCARQVRDNKMLYKCYILQAHERGPIDDSSGKDARRRGRRPWLQLPTYNIYCCPREYSIFPPKGKWTEKDPKWAVECDKAIVKIHENNILYTYVLSPHVLKQNFNRAFIYSICTVMILVQ